MRSRYWIMMVAVLIATSVVVVESRAVEAQTVEARTAEAQEVEAEARVDETSFDHPKLVLQTSTFLLEGDEESQPLAEISSHCLECHTSEMATEPGETLSLGPAEHSHPVGVVYSEGAPGYVSLSELDPRLTLIEGRLTCGTCHDLALPDHRLVLSEEQSELCMACHLR